MIIRELIKHLETLFPISLQESYDNSGNQIIFKQNSLGNILLALDINETIVNEAINNNCNLIINHHPLIFKPIKSIQSGDVKSEIIIKLIQNNINLFALHTNLDKIYFDKLGKTLGLSNFTLLHQTGYDQNNSPVGFGVLSALDTAIPLNELLDKVKDKLNLSYLLYSGNIDSEIKSIAILNGAGGNMIDDILSKNEIDCIITGDVGYHHMKNAIDNSVSVIDAGHFGTEFIFLQFLKDELQDYLTKQKAKNHVDIYITECEKNPFNIYIKK